MNITWHGLSCFEITTKTPSGEVTLVTDPYDNSVGLRFPRTLEADVLTMSHKGVDADNKSAVLGSPFTIDVPGEFEVKDVFVYSILAPITEGNHRITRIESETMSIAHLGALDRELNDEEIGQLQNVDILMLPIGGGRVLDGKIAAKVVAQVEPRVVIPMTFSVANLKEKLSDSKDFCKEIGVCRLDETNKYKISRKDLPEDEMEVIVLSK